VRTFLHCVLDPCLAKFQFSILSVLADWHLASKECQVLVILNEYNSLFLKMNKWQENELSEIFNLSASGTCLSNGVWRAKKWRRCTCIAMSSCETAAFDKSRKPLSLQYAGGCAQYGCPEWDGNQARSIDAAFFVSGFCHDHHAYLVPGEMTLHCCVLLSLYYTYGVEIIVPA
jgi:hypothetical protein